MLFRSFSREVHPHQYIAVHTPLGEEWRPLDKVYQDSITNICTAEQLCTVPPVFTGVIPFRQSTPHYLTIYPRQHRLAIAAGIQPLYVCSQAIRDQSSPDLPLGSIKYNFRRGIVNQGYHFEDTVRTSPHLYSYCFSPRIPEDPFDFISTYFEDEPL